MVFNCGDIYNQIMISIKTADKKVVESIYKQRNM